MTVSADELARLRNAHLVHLADLEDLRRKYSADGKSAPHAAGAVVECMRLARRWAERAGLAGPVLDLNLVAPDTQFGDL